MKKEKKDQQLEGLGGFQDSLCGWAFVDLLFCFDRREADQRKNPFKKWAFRHTFNVAANQSIGSKSKQ